MRKFIRVRLDIEGLHNWVDCDINEVAYLKNLHRHTFQIECTAEVTHGDRDIEFIEFKHKVKKYIAQKWYDSHYGCCNFGPMSCEHIAEDLLTEFGLTKCSVSEDGEFAGIVVA